MDLLKALNQPQKQAVTQPGGPLLVVSGPGSGKTRVLTYRVAWLIAQGIKPENILAVTFTNKAANEMKSRIQQLLKAANNDLGIKNKETADRYSEFVIPNPKLWIGTFHSICVRILREQISHIPYQPNFLIYDRKDSLALLKAISKNLKLDEKQFPAAKLLANISRAKAELINPERSQELWEEPALTIYKSVYEAYQQRLQKLNSLDFDDLLTQTVLLLQKQPRVLDYYQNKFRHILIDEYQDTNPAQYQLTKLLAQKHQNLTAVGDIDQSIYGFRNADFRNILNLQTDFPRLKIVKLEQNYRSTQNILTAADRLIQENKERLNKAIWTDNETGPAIALLQAADETEEAEKIIQAIEKLAQEHGYRLDDFAVLFRTNAQSRALEEALIRQRLPYRLIGAIRFYERAEIKDLLAFLRLLVNPADETSFRRIANRPPRQIGEKTLTKLMPHQKAIVTAPQLPANLKRNLSPAAARGAAELVKIFQDLHQAKTKKSLGQLVQKLINELGFVEFLDDGTEAGQARAENVKELISVAQAYAPETTADKVLGGFLENVALLSAQDELKNDQSALTLMTMHSAKGLEFPVVIISGAEEGLLPHYRSLAQPDQLEEERRLCYVAITRAKKHLLITFANRRRLYGRLQANPPSRFIFAIPEEITEIISSHE